MITPEGFNLGPFFVHYYGIIIMVGVLCGGFLAANRAKKVNIDPEFVWDLLIWLIIGGVIGARVWHILTPPPSSISEGVTTYFYLTHPLDAIAIWNGGLGIVGAIIGGALSLFFYVKKHKMKFTIWADISAPSLALGQAIGRWGNYFNQELYGSPTNLPWKMFIDENHRYPGFENVAYYHPLFLYESLLNLLNVILLFWINKRYKNVLKSGDLMLCYLVIYSSVRFLLEFLRLPTFSGQIAGANANQYLMIFVAISAALTLAWRHRRRASPSDFADKTDSS